MNRLPDEKSEYLVKLFLLTDLNNTGAFNEYGKIWTIGKKELAPEETFSNLIDASKACFQNGMFFQAKKLLIKAMEISPQAEYQKLNDYKRELDIIICHRQIQSVALQTRKILKKEFSLTI